MSSSSDVSGNRWEEVDPRVKWAIDAFDWEGEEPVTLLGHYAPYAMFGAIGAGIRPLSNYALRRPLWSAIQITALYTAAGLFAGHAWRKYKIRRNAEEAAVIKHYIMTHPELFPEPEQVKFGDRRVFGQWRIAR